MKRYAPAAAAILLISSFELHAQTQPTADQKQGNPRLDTATSTNDDTTRTSVREMPRSGDESGAVAGSRGRSGRATAGGTQTTRAGERSTRRSGSTSMTARVSDDVGRLQAILTDLTTHTNVADHAVRITANEAFMLANRISGRSRSLRAAGTTAMGRELRTHVAAMRSSVRGGDRTEAMRHAGEALRVANQLAGAIADTTT